MRQPPLWRSFGYAISGVWHVLRTQRNARRQVWVAVAVVVVGLILRIDRRDWALLALTIGAVLVAETINTMLEAVVDLLSPEYHDAAKIAKDVAAGAVLIISLAAAVVGLLILGPPLWAWVFGATAQHPAG